ncbi:MAG: Diguanylate cyclase with PAS/PAC sensor [Microgenomates group bacterium GW2011_GWC2_45_8]|nr:MAG: Diguanylate cyclase with PAS/PAC sensor [Microgenomates group bacterium GW2011_GWC2_45_8]
MPDMSKTEITPATEAEIAEAYEWNEIIDSVAGKDHLTGLPNRRAYERLISLEIERAKRSDQPLSLAILDIDDFKQVNDKYGHLTGDLVLQELAKIMKDRLRKIDGSARHGGEEFTVVFPGTSLRGDESEKNGAVHAAERLREFVAKNLQVEGQPVTLSIGVAQWRKDETKEDFFQRADKVLLEAKKAGKNQVRAAN